MMSIWALGNGDEYISHFYDILEPGHMLSLEK